MVRNSASDKSNTIRGSKTCILLVILKVALPNRSRLVVLRSIKPKSQNPEAEKELLAHIFNNSFKTVSLAKRKSMASCIFLLFLAQITT
jgi:hypothetical protein